MPSSGAQPQGALRGRAHFEHAVMRPCMRDLKSRRPISSVGDRSDNGRPFILNARLKAAEGAYSSKAFSTLTMCSV